METLTQNDLKEQAKTMREDNKIIKVDVLIIGFGLSVIPLLRELTRGEQSFQIISDGHTIWDELEANDRLDFDLVSSKHSSYYSFELVNHNTQDNYPTAKEFLDFQRKYQEQYQHYVKKDFAQKIENFDSFSIVHTTSGTIYQAKHCVIGTGFKRKITQSISSFNYDDAQNKTVVFTTIGDSANLMISKLIPRNARVILVTNGFVPVDKLVFIEGKSFTLDQLEAHNFRYISVFLFRQMDGGLIKSQLLPRFLVKPFFGDVLHVKHPITSVKKKIMQRFDRKPKSPFPNGVVALKYWPIDAYQQLFDNEQLEQSIENGYLLNDIAYFIDNGLVELWPKDEINMDRAAKKLTWEEKSVNYDEMIEGDSERPNLPDIYYHHPNGEAKNYSYNFRNTYMGIIPKELNNIYLIGYTRPTSGGLNNIIEMQSLFVHKMVTSDAFNDQTYQNLEDKIKKYDREYYFSKEHYYSDHLVYYGFYTQDMAKLIGIETSFRDCRSMKEVLQHYFFPNNAFKFRQKGEYKVEGVKSMVDKIWKEHKGFSNIRHYLYNYILTQIVIITTIMLLPIPLYFRIPLSFFQVFNLLMGFIVAKGVNIHRYLNAILLTGLVITPFYPSPWVPGITFLASFLVLFICRKLGLTRVPFNDLKNKKKYGQFYKRYVQAFENVKRKQKYKSDNKFNKFSKIKSKIT